MSHFQELQGKYLDTKFGKIYYKINKKGNNVLVLIHGLAASSKSWVKFVEYLPNDLTIILPDLLGHGESASPKIDYHVIYQKEIIEDILKFENITEYNLMGHSYGGWVSCILSLNNINVKKLILEDAGGLKDFFETVSGTEKRKKYKQDILSKALMLNTKEYVIKSIIDDEFSLSQLTKEELSSIFAKTLILWGENDTTIDKKYAEIFKNYIKNSEVFIIKNSKHTSHYSNPEETANIIKNFLYKD
ncbi:MAG: alpha/beta hydrolase [Candidatus Micrarchaeaceae archaeon]